MARRYGNFTPARRAALRRAQLISAQKRHARRRKIVAGAVGVAAVGGVVARHHLSKSKFIVGVKTPTVNTSRTSVSGSPVKFDSAGFRVGKGSLISHNGGPATPAGFRHIKTGPGNHAFVYIHRSGGNDRQFSYSHNTVRHALLGRKTTSRVAPNHEPAVPGGIRTPALLAIDSPKGILEGAAGSAPSRQIGYGHYPRTMKPNGFSIRRRMAHINARYGV